MMVEGIELIFGVMGLLVLMAVAGIIVSVFFSRKGDCDYARVVFKEYMEYRTAAGPKLLPDERSALDHALIDCRDSAFVLRLLDSMPAIGDRSSLHFIDQCAYGKGASAPAANMPEVRAAAVMSHQRLLARLEEDGKSASLLRAADRADEKELLRPVVTGAGTDEQTLLRPNVTVGG